MSAKIKFNIFNTLFNLFSFLADKTNGWIVFVKPKLLFGSLIVGLGVSACSLKKTAMNDESSRFATKCYMPRPIYMCYKPIAPRIETKEIPIPEEKLIFSESHNPEVMAIKEDDPMKVYNILEVEQKPEFPGGEKAVREFIQKEMRFPTVSCYEGGIGGVVYCRFIIEKDGTISNIEVTKSVYPLYDKEAVRVIERMPLWIPGKNNGKPVRVSYTVPVVFKRY
jgi:TonB family protein